jgi:Flp pilus assembly protein TadD
LVRVALLQVAATDLTGARYALEKALSERPDLLPARALMAEVDLRQGDLAAADQRARQIVAAYPGTGVGHALLGDVATARRAFDQAVGEYRLAHDIDKSSESLLRLYGAMFTAGNGAGALKLADRWLKDRPRDASVLRALADGHARQGDLRAARAAYEALLKVSPRDAEAMNNLANVLLLTDDAAALQVAEQAAALSPDAPHILGTLGWAAYKAGQVDRALQTLRDARLRDPENPDTRYFLATVLAAKGRKAEAKDEVNAALNSQRDFGNAARARDLLATLN